MFNCDLRTETFINFMSKWGGLDVFLVEDLVLMLPVCFSSQTCCRAVDHRHLTALMSAAYLMQLLGSL